MNWQKLTRKKKLEDILTEMHKAEYAESKTHGLKRALRVVDLTSFGIAAIVGAGIFSTIGNAAASGGPAVSLLFVFTAIACSFSALCYAQFASMIPVSGSAYTYAYTSFGELVAWIIGWDLLLEYAIGNIAVAISWSDYFTGLMEGLGLTIPQYLTMDFLSAMRGHEAAARLLAEGKSLEQIDPLVASAHLAWQNAPRIASVPLIADFPALLITAAITALVYVGIRESRNVSNCLVALKLVVIALVIAVGSFYVQPSNWNPFMPNGIVGVLQGVSAVFFAYIGFDAISTTAEECKNPQRDLPRGIIYSLLICTVLYVLISLTLTGMIHYSELGVGDPLAYAFKKIGMPGLSGIIAVSAVIAMSGVLLVFQMGQPRIWMSMSRDGLLPRAFSRIHPRFKTPSFSTIMTGVMVAIPALFLNLTEVTDLTSIGTLFAFILVCGGLLVLEGDPQLKAAKFQIPFVDSKYVLPWLLGGSALILYYFFPDTWQLLFRVRFEDASLSYWQKLMNRGPMLLFLAVCIDLTFLSFFRRLSLIPALGLLSSLYLMTELHITNWIRFLVWLAIGLVVYFTYSISHSRLNRHRQAPAHAHGHHHHGHHHHGHHHGKK